MHVGEFRWHFVTKMERGWSIITFFCWYIGATYRGVYNFDFLYVFLHSKPNILCLFSTLLVWSNCTHSQCRAKLRIQFTKHSVHKHSVHKAFNLKFISERNSFINFSFLISRLVKDSTHKKLFWKQLDLKVKKVNITKLYAMKKKLKKNV